MSPCERLVCWYTTHVETSFAANKNISSVSKLRLRVSRQPCFETRTTTDGRTTDRPTSTTNAYLTVKVGQLYSRRLSTLLMCDDCISHSDTSSWLHAALLKVAAAASMLLFGGLHETVWLVRWPAVDRTLTVSSWHWRRQLLDTGAYPPAPTARPPPSRACACTTVANFYLHISSDGQF